jgi:hypothetical protein
MSGAATTNIVTAGTPTTGVATTGTVSAGTAITGAATPRRATGASAPLPGAPVAGSSANCLPSGDGYFRAHVAGAIEAKLDWPNSGTRCQGESRNAPPGVRLSFQRVHPGNPNLLFVFGLTGVRQGQPAHEVGANLTIIVQGTSKIFGTLGDTRCTVDSLTQRALPNGGAYRVEARGFCTQPAHAVRGNGAILVSTFEFAGPVKYDSQDRETEEARR